MCGSVDRNIPPTVLHVHDAFPFYFLHRYSTYVWINTIYIYMVYVYPNIHIYIYHITYIYIHLYVYIRCINKLIYIYNYIFVNMIYLILNVCEIYLCCIHIYFYISIYDT